jgi:hypothetical protein
VLIGGAALAGLAAAAWLARPLRGARAWLASRIGGGDALFPAETASVFLAVADVIVPRDGDSPAASEIDFLPLFERFVRAEPGRLRLYREQWPAFAARVRALSTTAGQLPDADRIRAEYERWYAHFREARRGGDDTSRFAEQLRRDVLRVYYASPAGWAYVGYPGPARRGHP